MPVRDRGLGVDASDFLGFPLGSHHLVLPRRPVRAARAALALYDATLPHQRFAAAVGDLLLRTGGQRSLRIRRLPPVIDLSWWHRWCADVGADAVGGIGHLAFRVSDERLGVLLLAADGTPRGFVKAWPDPPGPWRPEPYLQPTVLRLLSRVTTGGVRVPALLREASYDGWHYQLFEPLPPGRHRRIRPDPRRIAEVADEIRARLSTVVRPPDVPPTHVVSHHDFTPRNVRTAGDGTTWIFDWEYAGWAPRLADELTFWTAEFAMRRWPRPRRDGPRVARILRERGTDVEIAEALRTETLHFEPTEEAIRRVVADEIGVAP